MEWFHWFFVIGLIGMVSGFVGGANSWFGAECFAGLLFGGGTILSIGAACWMCNGLSES